jgi:hypothetical protein
MRNMKKTHGNMTPPKANNPTVTDMKDSGKKKESPKNVKA